MAIDVSRLAFASQSGPIQLQDPHVVLLTPVDTLAASSIPGDVFSSPNVGDVYTLLSTGGVSGQVTYQGQALAEGATLTLADGHDYRISYKSNGGHDVTLTRVADSGDVHAPEQQFVAALYRTVLGRAADEAGLHSWVHFLEAGGTRLQVAQGFWSSPEHRGLQVDHFYATYLHRAADAAGRAHWVRALQGGVSEADVARGFLTSEEYRGVHASATAYLFGLYADVLGRAPDPDGLDRWQAAARAGLSREQLAEDFLTSREAGQQLLGRYYADFLGRSGDAAGVGRWMEKVQGGVRAATVAEAFLASDEFYHLAGH
jgi:hypothetical protein